MVSHRDEVFFGGGTPVLILIVMDNGLSPTKAKDGNHPERVLILIVMDNGLSPRCRVHEVGVGLVLILIVMDNGLSPLP